MNTASARVPQHVFLAFSTDVSGKRLWELETTLVGSTTLSSVGKNNENLTGELREQMKNETSWASFEQALTVGTDELEKALPHINSGNEVEYQLIPLADARRMGVQPISFASAGNQLGSGRPRRCRTMGKGLDTL